MTGHGSCLNYAACLTYYYLDRDIAPDPESCRDRRISGFRQFQGSCIQHAKRNQVFGINGLSIFFAAASDNVLGRAMRHHSECESYKK
jgi:hypothetical protein